MSRGRLITILDHLGRRANCDRRVDVWGLEVLLFERANGGKKKGEKKRKKKRKN